MIQTVQSYMVELKSEIFVVLLEKKMLTTDSVT